MSAEKEFYESIAKDLEKREGVIISQMFGSPALKFGKKAFSCLAGTAMVFKLPGTRAAELLNLPGVQLFDPSGMGRAMKEWAQVPFTEKARWVGLAAEALAYIKTLV